MTEHRCDPTLMVNQKNNPLTLSRSLRLAIATLDEGTNTGESATQVLREVQDCTLCLGAMLLHTVGIIRAFVEEDKRPTVVAELEGVSH